jgi:hypothetical protein
VLAVAGTSFIGLSAAKMREKRVLLPSIAAAANVPDTPAIEGPSAAERLRDEIVKHLQTTSRVRPAAGVERKAAKYSSASGEIARGYDLAVLRDTTLDAATERCSEDPHCQGLSFAAAIPATKRALETIVLKASRIASPKSGYWSWLKPMPTGLPDALVDGSPALDITLVTQTSVERLWMLKKLCAAWDGPVSAAVYVTGNQLAIATAKIEGSACARRGHVAYVQGKPTEQYPINALRNKALQWLTTSHWLLTDVDLWPSQGARATLLCLLREPWAAAPKTAIVVPAFATRHHDIRRMPATLETLAKCIGKRECHSFKGYPGAIAAHHLTTNYPYWWHQTTQPAESARAYKVPCFDTMVWEPYTLVPNLKSTPLFDERFTGYGKNKIQFVHHLRMLGFQFYVAPRAFLMHANHAKSQARAQWRHHKVAVDRLLPEFVDGVAGIRDQAALPLCTERLPQFTSILSYTGDNRQRSAASSVADDEDLEEESRGARGRGETQAIQA